jgi:hypothetical protein
LPGEQVTIPTLVMTGGPLDGTSYPLPLTSREVVVGSSMDAGVQIMLGNVEPFHARLLFSGSGLAIADAGSATGTFVNGEKVEGEQPLSAGDRICLGPPGAKGSAKLLVLLPAAGAAATAAYSPAPAPAFGGDTPALSFTEDDSQAPAFNLDGDGTGMAGEEPLFADPIPQVPAETYRPAPPPEPPPSPPAPAPQVAPAAPHVPASPPPPAPAPEAPAYHSELPSIPVEREPDSREFPSLRPASRPPSKPAAAKGKPKGKPRARRGGFSLPLVPLLGGVAALAVVGAGVWYFVLRKPAPAPRSAAQPQPAGAARAAAPAGSAPAAAAQPAPVSGLSPDVAMPGQVVLVRGQGLSGALRATVAGTDSPSVEATAEGARVTIPALPLTEGSKAELVLQAGSLPPQKFDLYIGRLPLVLDVKPKHGGIGDQVVLTGRGFMPEPSANAVTFAGQPALVVHASLTSLTVVAPAPPPSEMQPELPIVVTAGGRASSPTASFNLVRGSSSGFLPRFYGAPVQDFPGSGYTFVSTELGPVLLLGGAGDAKSVAERAVAFAAALNGLVANAQSKAPVFELRERPQPSVGIVGDVRPFLTPTAEDAAAYSKNWQTGRGEGRRVTPAAVARHWTALLSDYFGLFLYRQRPLRLAAISPHGRVFTDIYADANRRGTGTNVPSSVVLPVTEARGSGLRLAALVVSGDAVRAAVAVEGRWDGTMEDPDLGKRQFQVAMRQEGARLAGTLTTRRGAVELRAPLRDIAFDRGNLSFTADLQGTAFRFRGTLENNTVSGTIERAGKPGVPFTLLFVE